MQNEDQQPLSEASSARGPTARFLGLLAASLVLGGLLQFDLLVRAPWVIALHWTLLLACAALAWRVLEAYGRTGWREHERGFHVIFRASLIATVVSAVVLCALMVRLYCYPWDVERYLRALLLTVTVYLFANAAVVFATVGVLYLLSARLWTALFVGLTAWLALHVIHVSKLLSLQQHLYPWDYMLFDDLLEVLPLFLGSGGLTLVIVAFAVVALMAGLLAWREGPGEALKRRAVICGGGLLAALGLFLLSGIRVAPGDEDPSEYFPLWNAHSYHSHYNKTGLYFTLLRGTRHWGQNSAPEGYTADTPARLERTYPRTPDDTVPTADVIFYMIESLADLAQYGVTFREDPLPNFHAIQREGTAGRVVVPIYGGNTPNTEFEVLTGLSRVRPWPHDLSYAYRQWITDDTPALPWVFREWGYRTAVISGATGRYFGQAEAYPRLGFEAFHALGDRKGLPRKFGLVSDMAVFSAVEDALDPVTDADGPHEPCFLAITTDSTHGPYRGDHDPENRRFEVTNEDLPQAVRDVAEDHARALHHADEALGRLVVHLKRRKRPTLLFVYGDHKPAVNEFFDAGVLRDGWPGRVLDKYSTPLAIWSNVPLPGAVEDEQDLLLSANFLSVELFRRLGVRHPPSTFHYTQEVYKAFRVVSRVIGDRQGRFFAPEDVSRPGADLLRDYGLLKYHILVGGRR